MNQPIHIPSISKLHELAGAPAPDHPLMSILRVEDIPILPASFPGELSYGFYSIGLKKNLNGYVRYQRQVYDFQEGVMGFTAPNQAIAFNDDIVEGASGWILFFHSELLSRHPLAEKILNYGFFRYEVHEALHLSAKEEEMIIQIYENIHREYHQSIDQYSKAVILSNLELLLTYADRFYGRQFITRNEVDNSIIIKFEKLIHQYFYHKDTVPRGIPSVAHFAEQLHLSPNYLSDLLRALTGKSTQEHIHFHLLEKAKNSLLSTDLSIAEIAFELGFEYPQYFSRLFKQKVGQSPKAFRNAGKDQSLR